MSLSTRTKTLVAWSLWLASLGCCAGGLLATLLWVRPFTLGLLAQRAAQAVAYPLGYATIGLVLGLRRPANPIGWLYAASGLLWALVIPFAPLAVLVHDPQSLPLALQLAWVPSSLIWAPAVALGITLPFLLLPDGRLRSRRWRPVVAATVAGVAMFLVGATLTPGQQWMEDPIRIDNPLGLAGVAGQVAAAVTLTGLALYTVGLAAALVCVVLRFRASRGVERQQLRWVAAGAAVAVLVLLPLPGQ